MKAWRTRVKRDPLTGMWLVYRPGSLWPETIVMSWRSAIKYVTGQESY